MGWSAMTESGPTFKTRGAEILPKLKQGRFELNKCDTRLPKHSIELKNFIKELN